MYLLKLCTLISHSSKQLSKLNYRHLKENYLRHEPVISYQLLIMISSCCNPGFHDLSFAGKRQRACFIQIGMIVGTDWYRTISFLVRPYVVCLAQKSEISQLKQLFQFKCQCRFMSVYVSQKALTITHRCSNTTNQFIPLSL